MVNRPAALSSTNISWASTACPGWAQLGNVSRVEMGKTQFWLWEVTTKQGGVEFTERLVIQGRIWSKPLQSFPTDSGTKESWMHIPWGQRGLQGRVSIWPRSRGLGAFLEAQMVKRLLAMWETWVWSLSWEDPLEKEMEPTLVLLPGKFHGWKSLVGYSP